ncbi:hypothetical protein ST47_g189 [Ascochyta rabiei]|uniref:Uncharacterized protein n=1 Tax=Didymella rabiei TaxID=5454 RepID=A0A163MF01_DIDRA|nr:hypothetical protein ST47_g189 [Ascochyta rabiei]
MRGPFSMLGTTFEDILFGRELPYFLQFPPPTSRWTRSDVIGHHISVLHKVYIELLHAADNYSAPYVLTQNVNCVRYEMSRQGWIARVLRDGSVLLVDAPGVYLEPDLHTHSLASGERRVLQQPSQTQTHEQNRARSAHPAIAAAPAPKLIGGWKREER